MEPGRPSILELLLQARARMEGQAKVEARAGMEGRGKVDARNGLEARAGLEGRGKVQEGEGEKGVRKKVKEKQIAPVPKKRKLEEKQDENCKFEAKIEAMTRSLVVKYLQGVAPGLARELRGRVRLVETEVALEEVVAGYRRQGIKLRIENQKPVGEKKKISKGENKKVGFKLRRFMAEEDDVIMAAISQGEIDSKEIAKQLNRSLKSVIERVQILKRTGGKKVKSSRFTLPEDLLILETLILPRLRDEKLSAITLTNQNVRELASKFNRSRNVVVKRWVSTLQPTLLQHYSGTLNLRVERMLASFILENFTDYSDIRWEEVAVRREFAGHTITSLKHIYLTHMRPHAARKFNIEASEVSLKDISIYCEEVTARAR